MPQPAPKRRYNPRGSRDVCLKVYMNREDRDALGAVARRLGLTDSHAAGLAIRRFCIVAEGDLIESHAEAAAGYGFREPGRGGA